MASRLIIEQEPLKVGQVRKVTSNKRDKCSSAQMQTYNGNRISS